MNYLQGFLFAPLALISPNTAIPIFLLWLGLTRLSAVQTQLALIKADFPLGLLKTLALLLAWTCLTSFWSLSPYDSAIANLKLLVLSIFGLSWLSFCFRQSVNAIFVFLKGLAIGCSCVAIFMLFDRALGGTFVHFKGFTGIKVYSAVCHILALCFYPLCFWIYKYIDPLSCFLFAFLMLAALYTIDIDIILIALVIGALFQGLAFLLPRKSFKFLWQTSFVLLIGTFPLCMFFLSPTMVQAINYNIPIYSYIHRLHIWSFLSGKIILHPWIGHGLYTSHLQIVRPSFYTWTFLEKTTNNPVVIQHSLPHEPLFWHAHNVLIQWWFELGFVGVFLGGLFFFKIFARVHSWPHSQRILTLGYSGLVIAIALVSVDFWNSWWFSALWISSGIVILVNRMLDQIPKLD